MKRSSLRCFNLIFVGTYKSDLISLRQNIVLHKKFHQDAHKYMIKALKHCHLLLVLVCFEQETILHKYWDVSLSNLDGLQF